MVDNGSPQNSAAHCDCEHDLGMSVVSAWTELKSRVDGRWICVEQAPWITTGTLNSAQTKANPLDAEVHSHLPGGGPTAWS